eukprot:217902-Chlamydomonas_euryale.AAC.4
MKQACLTSSARTLRALAGSFAYPFMQPVDYIEQACTDSCNHACCASRTIYASRVPRACASMRLRPNVPVRTSYMSLHAPAPQCACAHLVHAPPCACAPVCLCAPCAGCHTQRIKASGFLPEKFHWGIGLF